MKWKLQQFEWRVEILNRKIFHTYTKVCKEGIAKMTHGTNIIYSYKVMHKMYLQTNW